MRTLGIVASLATFAGLALVTTTQTAAQQRPAEGRSEGPIVRRVLSRDDGRTVAFARQAPSVFMRVQIDEVVVAATGAGDGDWQVVATGGGGSPIIINPAPRISPRGDKVLYVRHDRQSAPPGPATLWVVGSDGRGARQIAMAARIYSMVWNPGGRFVAYITSEGTADSSAGALRIVDVETGVDRRIPLPSAFLGDVEVCDWSRDGSLLGIIASTQPRSNEYWVVQGLVEEGR